MYNHLPNSETGLMAFKGFIFRIIEMLISYEVFFFSNAPAIEQVINKLNETTGLEFNYDYELSTITCTSRKTRIIFSEIKESAYCFECVSPAFDYVVASLLFVLIYFFNGKYEYKHTFPAWAGKKFNDVAL